MVIEGAVTMDTINAVRAECVPLMAKPNVTAVDLSAVTKMDSTIVALALALSRDAQKLGKTIRFGPVPETFKTLSDLYGVSALLPVIP